jgi:hypothetical protein
VGVTFPIELGSTPILNTPLVDTVCEHLTTPLRAQRVLIVASV